MTRRFACTLLALMVLVPVSQAYAAPWLYWTGHGPPQYSASSRRRQRPGGAGGRIRERCERNRVALPSTCMPARCTGPRAEASGSGGPIWMERMWRILVTTGLSFPADIQLDLANGKLYFADRDRNAIRRCDLNGANLQDVRTGATQAYFLYVDLPRSRVYWSEGQQHGDPPGESRRQRDDRERRDRPVADQGYRAGSAPPTCCTGTIAAVTRSNDGRSPGARLKTCSSRRTASTGRTGWPSISTPSDCTGRTRPRSASGRGGPTAPGAAQLLYSAATSSLVSNPWGIVLAVPLCGSFVSPDLNHDCYVDKEDVTLFAACFTGPLMPIRDGCGDRDFDGDRDVDQADFGVLQRCYSGSRPVADSGCDD